MKNKAQEQQTKNMELLIKRSPKLELFVLDGPTLEKGLFVKINALGTESRASVRMAYLN
jgi:hypothetical protein